MLSTLKILVVLLIGEGLCREGKRDYDPLHNECAFEHADRQPCGRKHDILGEAQCYAKGCCFDNSYPYPDDTPRCFLAHRMLVPQCDIISEDKDDCGYYGILEGECLMRGCCWQPGVKTNDPDCFKPNSAGILRLRNGDSESQKEGRVEVFHNNEWGTICDDGFNDQVARVICRQLGYHDGLPQCCAAYGEGQGQIWLDSMSCYGHEDSFEECSHDRWGQHDCSHSEDASVVCYNEGEEIPTTTPYHYYYATDYPIYPDYYGSGNGGRKRKGFKRFNNFKWFNGKQGQKSSRGQGGGRFKQSQGFKYVEP